MAEAGRMSLSYLGPIRFTDVASLVRGLVETIETIVDMTDGREPGPDPGCDKCTSQTVPHRLNRGLCARHAAVWWLEGGGQAT